MAVDPRRRHQRSEAVEQSSDLSFVAEINDGPNKLLP